MNIDQMIERLQELREVAGTGDIPVVVPDGCEDDREFELAACQLQFVAPHNPEARTFRQPLDSGETSQVVAVF